MSAFVVTDKTINQVVFYLTHCDRLEYLKRELAKAAEIDRDDLDFSSKLAVSLLQLNTDAVCQRYPDIPHDAMLARAEFNPSAGDFRPHPIVCSDIQAYKSLGCLLYQCSEGNVPERPLYQVLRQAEHTLADQIISRTSEYQEADWG